MFVPPPPRKGDLQLGLALELVARWLRRDLLVMRISDEAMLPTLRPLDVLFCSRTRRPWLGAIVIEEQGSLDGRVTRRVKRITGLAGDTCVGVQVPSGFAWLEGDNRAASTDSREHGPIPTRRLRGVAIALLRSHELQDLRFRINGPKRTPRSLFLDSCEVWWDWSRGIATRGFIRADEFGFSPSRVLAYVATPWDVALQALDSIDISADDVFVDYGCGKGRMLALALRYPFRHVVGIEIISAHAAAARRSLARHGERCEIVEADASSFPLPDEATVIYAFNPFGGEVLPEVVKRIRESLARRPRPIRLITYGIQPSVLALLLPEPPRLLPDRLLLEFVLQPPQGCRRDH